MTRKKIMERNAESVIEKPINFDPSVEGQIGLIESYKSLFHTDEGITVLADLQRYCFKHNTTWQGDKDVMLLNEGRRSVALYIESMINLDTSALDKKEE